MGSVKPFFSRNSHNVLFRQKCASHVHVGVDTLSRKEGSFALVRCMHMPVHTAYAIY